MVLEELHELIETLQGRIAEHGPALQQSEALTRYALIDPLLRGLGWDTGDPSQVLVEYRSSAGSADYALLGVDQKPRIIVEAKRLGTSLHAVATQGINYCVQSGVQYFALTDGQHWELYETFQPVPLEEKLVIALDLKSSTAETCLDAMALWRPGAAAGRIRKPATPVVGSPVARLGAQVPAAQEPQSDTPPVETDHGWLALNVFSPQPGLKPTALRFPDGEVSSTTNWGDFIVGIVEWLQRGGHLTNNNVPVRFGDQTQNLIATTEPNRAENPFGVYRSVGAWFVKTNYAGGQHARNARNLIQLARLDPADFAVKLQ